MSFFHTRNWDSPLERLRRVAHPGRHAKKLAGTWVDDLANLGKTILLCGYCSHKFNKKRYGYKEKDLWPGQSWVQGDCDGCKQMTRCTMYCKET